MKKVIFISLILINTMGMASISGAQDQKNILSINPLGIPLLGAMNIEFEAILSDYSGMAVYWSETGHALPENDGVTIRGSEQRITYRYYWAGNAPGGIWSGVSTAYSSGYAFDSDSSIYGMSILVGSIEAGYRFVWGNFNIAPLVMGRFIFTDDLFGEKRVYGEVNETQMVALGLGLNIGWGW